MHFFTSISTNYLPKARVLAKSIQDHCKDFSFTLVVSDDLPNDFNIENEPFDEILYVEDLDLPVDNLPLWIFKHTVVELCTAVKGAAILKLLNKSSYDKIVYLDPDIAVFDSLDELSRTLDKADIVLTPHQCVPETNKFDIVNNEICSLQHGIYNLGFIALRRSDNAFAFAKWWRDRLVDFCVADIPHGIFTDQRWCDFVPAFFENVFIERSPVYNVSTWNLSHREVTEKNGRYWVNGMPLQFYHFSGFDSGGQESVLLVYGKTKAVWNLRKWYINAQNENMQERLGKLPSKYACFSNGEKITEHQRKLLRNREDLIKHFKNTNPFLVDNTDRCYYHWYKANGEKQQEASDVRVADLERKLNMVKRYLSPLLWIRRLYLRFTRKR